MTDVNRALQDTLDSVSAIARAHVAQFDLPTVALIDCGEVTNADATGRDEALAQVVPV